MQAKMHQLYVGEADGAYFGFDYSAHKNTVIQISVQVSVKILMKYYFCMTRINLNEFYLNFQQILRNNMILLVNLLCDFDYEYSQVYTK